MQSCTGAKDILRSRMRAAAAALTPEARRAGDRVLADRLLALPELKGAETVLLFCGVGTEPDTRPIAEALWAAGPGNHPAYLHMNGQEVFQFALKTVPELARSLLDKAGMDRDQIDWYVLHQANHRILEGVAKRMKVPLERFYENIGRYGNTSAATIPIALDEMAEQELLRPGQWIMCLGFGAGLTWGGAMFRW